MNPQNFASPPRQRIHTESNKELTPVKLGSYMAERQASKGKNILSRIKSNQFISKLECAGLSIEAKRDMVERLLQKLMVEIGKKKQQLQTRTMEELYEEERAIEGMMKIATQGFRQRLIREQFEVKYKPKKIHFEMTEPISPISSKEHIEIQNIKLKEFVFEDFKLNVIESGPSLNIRSPKALKETTNMLEVIPEKRMGSPRVSPILRNTSMSCYGGSPARDSKSSNRVSNKLSHLELKLESRVKFKEVPERK